MAISKVGILLVVGILAAVAAGVSYLSSETSAGSILKSPTGLLTKVGFGDKEYATVEFTADVSLDQVPELALSFSEPLESFALSYGSLDQQIFVGGLPLSSGGNSELEFSGYTGKVEIRDVATFNGEADRFRYNTIFTKGEEAIDVAATDVAYDKIVLSGVQKTTLSFPSVTGTLSGKKSEEGEFTVRISGKLLQLNDFQGTMTLEGNTLKLSGVAAIKTSLLQTN